MRSWNVSRSAVWKNRRVNGSLVMCARLLIQYGAGNCKKVYLHSFDRKTSPHRAAIFVWDFPHFVKAREIYLFIYLFICGFYLAFSEPWRLDSSRRFFIVYYTAAISLLSRWVLENLFGISYFFLGNFCFQGKDRSFHIFTGSFRALTFQFCCGSFTIKLSGKATTFVHLVCVLSYIIWGVGNIYNGVICD